MSRIFVFLMGALVCSGANAQPNITIDAPTVKVVNGREVLCITGSVNMVPQNNAVCWEIDGPPGQPLPNVTIVEQLNGQNMISTNVILAPGQGFANGTYKIRFGDCVNGGLTNGQQRCVTIIGGNVKMVTPQMPVRDPDDRPFEPTRLERVVELMAANKAVFVSELDSAIVVEPTEVDIVCVAQNLSEADATQVLESDATFE